MALDDRRNETPEARRVGIVIEDDMVKRMLGVLFFLVFFIDEGCWRGWIACVVERGDGRCSVGKRAVDGQVSADAVLTRPKRWASAGTNQLNDENRNRRQRRTETQAVLSTFVTTT